MKQREGKTERQSEEKGDWEGVERVNERTRVNIVTH